MKTNKIIIEMKEQNYNNELKNKLLLAENKNNALILEINNYKEEISKNKNIFNDMNKDIQDLKNKYDLKQKDYEQLINEKNK